MTDWQQLKKHAFGALGLRPWEFWRLTPAEFIEMCDGYNAKVEHEMERLAWHAATVINPHIKKKVTPKQLLGKDKKSQNMDERKKQIEKLKKMQQKLKSRE